ncbi:TPA: hypothetical protein EYO12_02915 [Candidatus Saccharibacteria bacterium]|nr:hypothetical protein [Candidatus Saccharibacteria bacterium]HIO88011.1 hypothetical protein [Candidatus Saccharibacteria bacterium]
MSDKNFDFDKTVESIKKDRNLMLLVGGAAALIVGLFLPWASASAGFISFSVNGFDANGALPLILAALAVVAGLNLMNQKTKTMWAVALGASALALLMVLVDWPSDDGLGVVSIGVGYYLSLAGSLAMTAGSGMKFKELQDSKSTPSNKK